MKNPFDGQDNKDGDKNRNIPGKLKNKFGGEGQEEPELNKFGGKDKKEEDEKYKNLLNGNLTPEDPVNNEFINNLEVLADPVYNPENYVFVNKFNNEMDKIMNKLGKYEEEPSPEEEEQLEVTENYLSHLNTLFNK